MPDLIGGRLQLMWASPTVMPALMKDGKFRPLAVLLPERSAVAARCTGRGTPVWPWAGPGKLEVCGPGQIWRGRGWAGGMPGCPF